MTPLTEASFQEGSQHTESAFSPFDSRATSLWMVSFFQSERRPLIVRLRFFELVMRFLLSNQLENREAN